MTDTDTPHDPDAAGRMAELVAEAEVFGLGYVTLDTADARAVLAELADAKARIDQLEAEHGQPEERVEDVVQLVIPRGPMLDGLQKVLRALNCTMAGPLPLEREPIPTYVLQPLTMPEQQPPTAEGH